MLEISDLVAPYAIRAPLSLRSGAAEAVALVGPNGAGKTTLMRLIAGLLPAEGGEIKVAGQSVHNIDAPTRAELVGFLPQTESPVSGFSVSEVVALGCYARRRLLSAWDASEHVRVEKAIKAVGLAELKTRDAGTLSGGEFQRVRVARAIAQAPRLLLLDEPLAHLDPGQAHRVAGLLASLGGHGQIGCLAALHDINVAALYFDRILLMKDGLIIADGPPDEVIKSELLNPVYETQFHVVDHPLAGRPQVLGLGIGETP